MRPAAVGLLLLAALVGCETRERSFEATVAPPSVMPSRPVRPVPGDAGPPTAETPEPPPIPGAKPARSVLLASRTDLDPERLIGLSQVETESLLGQPALQDEKPPAKVWIYNAQSCVLSIFFYADISTRDFRALTYEIKTGEEVKKDRPAGEEPSGGAGPTEDTDVADRQCIAELMNDHTT